MIELGEDYKIDADKHQYILHTRSVTTHEKAKSPYTWNQTYHASIKQCCAAIVNNQARIVIERDLLNEFLPSIDRLCLAVKLAEESELSMSSIFGQTAEELTSGLTIKGKGNE